MQVSCRGSDNSVFWGEILPMIMSGLDANKYRTHCRASGGRGGACGHDSALMSSCSPLQDHVGGKHINMGQGLPACFCCSLRTPLRVPQYIFGASVLPGFSLNLFSTIRSLQADRLPQTPWDQLKTRDGTGCHQHTDDSSCPIFQATFSETATYIISIPCKQSRIAIFSPLPHGKLTRC